MINTLDTLTQELEKKGFKNKEAMLDLLHGASMLSFIESANCVMRQSTMPTPLYRFTYDHNAHNLQFEQLDGRARVPNADSLDINMFDIMMATMLREKMPVMFEGKTGIGKTYTAEQFAKTILGKDNYVILRLSNNMSNVFQPYTEGFIENGVVKIKLRKDQTQKVGMLIVDECNRGDTNQILQLQDGIIRLSSGEGAEIGIPIPEYDKDKKAWSLNTNNLRPTFMVSAQNPASTKDAKYSQTKRTDAAQNNRNMQIDMPNTASRNGASMLLLNQNNGYHKSFLNEFEKNLKRHIGLEDIALDELKNEWSSIYAFATDPKKTECSSIKSAIEFMDMIPLICSPKILKEFNIEKEDIKDWNDNTLRKYGIDFSYNSVLDESAESVTRLQKITRLFEEDYVPRDTTKVKKLSDAISTLRRIKKSFSSDDPVKTYLTTPNYITVQDMACGYAILLHDKQDNSDDPETNPTTLIDTVLKEYIDIVEGYSEEIKYKTRSATNPNTFDSEDKNMAVYNLAFQHAFGITNKKYLDNAATVSATVTIADSDSSKEYLNEFITDLGSSVAILKRLDVGEEYRKLMISRMIADITTLTGFIDQYKSDINSIFIKRYDDAPAKDTSMKMDSFKQFVKSQKTKIDSPDIYMQRLTRTIGV